MRLVSEQCIDLHDYNFVLNEPSFEILRKLISHDNTIDLTQEIDSRDADANRHGKRLKKLERIDKFIFEERGAKDLYIGWPFVRGKFSDDTLVRGPLLFFPIELINKNNLWSLKLRKDVNITFNKSFLLAYSFFNQTPLDEELLETTFNDFDRDSTVFRTQLYELLKNSNLEINFNQDNFIDELKSFKDFKRSDYEAQEKTGSLKLFPEAVLGIFPQAGSYLVPDYINLIENEKIKDLEDFFFQRQREDLEDEGDTRFSDRLLEENTFTPFELDAYQERALGLIKKGNSMIVQGPPGTGKSQLISNLICDYIARGKNILLVCQKKAALDVVYERLKSKDLHNSIGLVHDFKNDRKDIFHQIATQIDRIDEYKQKNNSLDAIQLERSFQQASRKIDQSVEELEEFKTMLFDESECGKSIKELYLSSDPTTLAIPLNQEYRSFHYHEVEAFKDRLSRYLRYYREFEGKKHFWIGGKSFAQHSVSDLVNIRNTVTEVIKYSEEIEQKAHDIIHKPVDFESAQLLADKPEELERLISNLDNERAYRYFQHIVTEAPISKSEWLAEEERRMMQCFKGYGPESSLKAEKLGKFQEALEHAINARKGVLSWLRWKLFSADRNFIRQVLHANELKANREGFQVLLDKIDNRLNYEHVLSELTQVKWLSDFPTSLKKTETQNWFFYQKLALNTYELLDQLRPLESLIPFHKNDRKSQLETLSQLQSLVKEIPVARARWGSYLSEQQIRSLTLKKISPDEAVKSLNKDFDKIYDYHGLRDGFTQVETKIIEDLLEASQDDLNPETIMVIFNNSLALAWIDHIETKYPILRAVSSHHLETLEKTLKDAVEDKKQVSSDILLLKSRERTYEDLEYNRLNNLVTYRDLYHQVTKKRRIWPIRRVVTNFSEELFKLLPCWMASPESASAIFPMQEMFDLVIFDEASQCFAEKAIPALYRGKQVVIAGDSKQLKPFDMYRVRWEDENSEDLPELDIDSLLDLAQQFLPDTSLAGHYRSQSLELIDFSNQHFYDGRLHMLPSFEALNHAEPAIAYLKVDDGIWENNINDSEASQVVDLIFELQKSDPKLSIGVVTFNARQQGHILDLLEARAIELKQALPDKLIVKNIENIQGDERDVIIFSTAYAPDKKGKLQMRFGPLNQQGGENRLNVAVTRAREKIYVISSILPAQIRAEDTKNPGPLLFKKFLEHAWAVSNKNWIPGVTTFEQHEDRWYLRNRLQLPQFHGFPSLNLQKTYQFSDLTISQNSKNRGIILTDDEVFHDSPSVKDAFVYFPNLLVDKKWPYSRIYSRAFWLDRDTIQERMKMFLNRISED